MSTFDYTSRDFASIRNDLLTRAANMPGMVDWSTQSTSDFGVMLVDLWAYMGDVLHFYIDRAAAETFIGTATQRESLLAFANLFDYQHAPVNSATASVTVTLAAGTPGTTIIPVNTAFVAPARNSDEMTVYFTSTSSASLSSASSTANISLVEGIRQVDEAPIHYINRDEFSDGSTNQEFNLRYANVVPSSVVVNVYEGAVVNGEATPIQYQYVSKLSDSAAYEKVFTTETAADGLTSIIFGNGINGKIPTNGAKVLVTYRRSVGESGNIVANRITSFVNGAPTGVSIASSSAAGGGYDAESINSLRANIPLAMRTQNRAVSLQDFKDLALTIPGVVKSTATNSGSSVTIYPLLYQPDYLTTSASAITIPSDVRTNTVAYFADKTLLGASVTAATSVVLKPVYVHAAVQVADGYVQQWVLNDVVATLDNFFTFDNVSFEQVLSLGAVYKALHSIAGVDYVNITTFGFANTVNTIQSGNKVIASSDGTTSGTYNVLLRKGSYTLTASGGVTAA